MTDMPEWASKAASEILRDALDLGPFDWNIMKWANIIIKHAPITNYWRPVTKMPEIGRMIIFRSISSGWMEGTLSPTFRFVNKFDSVYVDIDYWMEIQPVLE